ncbi:MAG: YcgN family cysteine cluster protein, partial [Acetobacteraceae bacterium]
MTEPRPFWRTKSLAEMTDAEWESLCDGCGRCCLHKLRDEASGALAFTNVACRLLDTSAGRCTDYEHRRRHVRDCVRLKPEAIGKIDWLPPSCAYRRLAKGLDLPSWHPLISGDPESVRRAGASVA